MSFKAHFEALPPSLSLRGRTALITGASSGIGRQTALHLARSGCAILCADLDATTREQRENLSQRDDKNDSKHVPTHELINALGGAAAFQKTDVSDETSFEGAVVAALKLSRDNGEKSPDGRLDIFVNNAGVAHFSGGVADEPIATFVKSIDVNLRGVYIGCQLAVRQMLKQEPRALPCDAELDLDSFVVGQDGPALRPPYDTDDAAPETSGRLKGEKLLRGEEDVGARGSRGVIINIGSIHGVIGGPGEPAYAAAKGGVVNFSRQVATDYAPYRINCNCICPGYLDTAMTASVSPELSALRPTLWPHRGNGRDVAKMVVYLARDAAWVTGSTLVIDGATTAR